MARDMDELQTVSRDDVSQPKAPPVVSARHCPALQDIHGDVANILARSVNCSSEETMNELFNAVNLAKLREARSVLFGHVTGYVLEHEDAASGDLDCFRLKQRRGVKAGISLALNNVKLFNYMCGLDCSFPGSVLASKGPTSASLLAGPQAPRQQSPTLTPHCSPLKDPCPGSHQEVSLSPPLTPASQELPCAQPQGAKASSPVSQSQRTSPGHSTSKLSDSPFGLMGSPQTITSSFSLSSMSIPLSDIPEKASDGHSPCCCDHGRAIIDLRCTVDIMQLELDKLQTQLREYCTMQPRPNNVVPPAQAGGMGPCGGAEAALLTLPSPPESRPPSAIPDCDISLSPEFNTSSSLDSFSDIFGLHVPNKNVVDGEANDDKDSVDLMGTQPDQSSASIRDRTVGAATNAVCDGSMADTPAGNDEQASISASVEYMHGEVDSLRTLIHEFDDRIVAVEMSDATQNQTIESIKRLSKKLWASNSK